MDKPVRVNLWSGAGNGKSTKSAEIFADLKRRGYNCELIKEYYKKWAYEKKECGGYDQFYAFAKHLKEEQLLVKAGVDIIINDSPLGLQLCYCLRDKLHYTEQLISVWKEQSRMFYDINIVLRRNLDFYKPYGRWGTINDAILMDNIIELFIVDNKLKIYRRNPDDQCLSLLVEGLIEQ